MVRPGDRVRFDGAVHTVVGISGMLVRLADGLGQSSAMHLPTLMTAPGFEVVGSGPGRLLPSGLLDGLEAGLAERALWWHRHMTEVLTGLAPDAPAGTVPRPEYDPASSSLADREATKAAELSVELGHPVSRHTVRRRRQRYQKRGVLGMVDGRHAPRRPPRGQVDSRVVDELRKLMDQAADGSTRTVSYYFTRVGRAVKKLDGPPVTMPSRATFYRLFNRLEAGRHTTGSARTRRSLASQPDGAFDQVTVCRPGELMEIDSTPFDVLVRLHRHPSGALPGQAKYLYQRTGGSISSLSHLIRASAISAIIDGSERITRRLLDSVPVDHSTQSDNPAPSDGEDDGIEDAA
ncbi:hypothetical protein [Streptomyces sp. NBC_01314]|uniref:hypothetical protein n=1 Tax=Streptomyces sp. NBC_01314 TaxID=2903821 RepID=UPI00308D94F4|nr:hypothetical protein OG622_00910 [Streptomyces sp. NBC_01314]